MSWKDVFKSDSEKKVKPYGPAREPLDLALGITEDALSQPWDPYTGDRVAGFTPEQLEAFSAMGEYARPGGAGYDAAQALSGAGGNLIGGYGDAAGIYRDVAGMGAPQVGQLDMDYANSIADNPYMDSMVDAAGRDIMRNFSEGALPAIEGEAWARNDTSGSYRGIREGIAQRGAQDAIGDIDSFPNIRLDDRTCIGRTRIMM